MPKDEPLTAYVLVSDLKHDTKEVIAILKKIDSIQEAVIVFGEFDLLLKTRVTTMDELKEVVFTLRKNLSAETTTLVASKDLL
ncbi:MAG: Lrp/AsnC ligand binding domain-containing protein [Candidatus Ranarchaeia archaeon]|jgi:DNA-binding Lrp family transcriptional regulator